jgi:hypothetical protein
MRNSRHRRQSPYRRLRLFAEVENPGGIAPPGLAPEPKSEAGNQWSRASEYVSPSPHGKVLITHGLPSQRQCFGEQLCLNRAEIHRCESHSGWSWGEEEKLEIPFCVGDRDLPKAPERQAIGPKARRLLQVKPAMGEWWPDCNVRSCGHRLRKPFLARGGRILAKQHRSG